MSQRPVSLTVLDYLRKRSQDELIQMYVDALCPFEYKMLCNEAKQDQEERCKNTITSNVEQ